MSALLANKLEASMTSSLASSDPVADAQALEATSDRPARPSAALGYALSLAMVAAATLVAFVADNIARVSNLSLVFVIPVIIAAVRFGWGPGVAAALLGVAIFDFLFVEPRFSLRVDSPTDILALALLLVVAAIASTIGAQARRRALEARRAAERAEALHALAHAVIKADPAEPLLHTAAEALSHIFDAPATVLAEQAGKLWPTAHGGRAILSLPDIEAAQWALANDKPTRADTYPFDQAVFDFWPVQTPANRRLVLGVKLAGASEGRPTDADLQVELVAAYLAAATAGRRPG
jgi:two-component system sensor histidine kinase KdpD